MTSLPDSLISTEVRMINNEINTCPGLWDEIKLVTHGVIMKMSSEKELVIVTLPWHQVVEVVQRYELDN